jgi:fatty acid desaturase
MVDAGLFEIDYSFYKNMLWRIGALLFAAFGLTIFGKGCVGVQLLGAMCLGMFWHQLMLMGHDICHNSVLGRKGDLQLTRWISTAVAGISGAWWKASHNTHHIVTNSIVDDPDIQHLPFFAINQKFFKSLWSTWHNHKMVFDAPAKFLVQNQCYLFYPIMCVARIFLYVQSIIHLLTKEKLSRSWTELMGYPVFFGWVGFLVCQMPTWQWSVAYILTSHAIAGMLHVQICLSHFPMETMDEIAHNNESDVFMEHQLSTTMDITCPEYMDWFHGGLQFQVEHHLFPTMPRHNLRKAQQILLKFCKKHGLTHTSKTFFDANVFMLKSMYNVSKDASLSESRLNDMLNARG